MTTKTWNNAAPKSFGVTFACGTDRARQIISTTVQIKARARKK
jgi:hypothetical protein